MDIDFIGGYLPCDDFAADVIFFSIIFAIFQFFGTIDNIGLQGLHWQQFEERLIILDINIFF